jgi:hypothetical protein
MEKKRKVLSAASAASAAKALVVIAIVAALVAILAFFSVGQSAVGCCCNIGRGATQSLTFLEQYECTIEYPDFVVPINNANGQTCDVVCKGVEHAVPTCGGAAAPPVMNVRGTGVKGRQVMRVSWDLQDAACSPLYSVIERCPGTSCKDKDWVVVGVTSRPTYFDDIGRAEVPVEWKKVYSYRVTANYQQASAKPAVGTGTLGDIECWGIKSNDPFCLSENHLRTDAVTAYLEAFGYDSLKADAFKSNFNLSLRQLFAAKFNAIIACNDVNVATVQKKCQEGTQCFQKYNEVPQCIAPQPCIQEGTGGFLGLEFTADSCERRNSRPTYCFFDRGVSTADYCYSCNPSMACYDYKSSGSCGRDPCAVGRCAWAPIQGVEMLGVGVCKDTRFSNCAWCGESGSEYAPNSAAYNTIYTSCSDEAAAALSTSASTCFFNKDSPSGKANSCGTVVCTDFDINECGSPVGGIKLGADNAIVEASVKNACSIPVCQWFGSETLVAGARCRKNADGVENEGRMADCPPGQDGAACEKDYFPPVTLLTTTSKTGVTDAILIRVTDQKAPDMPAELVKGPAQATAKIVSCNESGVSSLYTTYICVQDGASGPCSDAQQRQNWVATRTSLLCINDGKVYAEGSVIMNLTAGLHTLYYFTEDPFHNVEVVKTMPISTCAACQGPTLDSLSITPTIKYGEVYYTNAGAGKAGSPMVEAVITFTESAQLTSLRLGTPEYPANIIIAPAGGFTKTVKVKPKAALPDGRYALQFDAMDDKGTHMVPPGGQAELVVDTVVPNLMLSPRNGAMLATDDINVVIGATESVILDEVNLAEELLYNDVTFALKDNFLAANSSPGSGFNIDVPFRLASGRKVLTVKAHDIAGNAVTATSEFRTNAGAPVIALKAPRFGVTNRVPVNVIITTSEAASCKYWDKGGAPAGFDNLLPITKTTGMEHTILAWDKLRKDGDTAPLFVMCRDTQGNTSDNSFVLRVDTTPPQILGLAATPNPVVETPLETVLSVQATKPVFCRYGPVDNEGVLSGDRTKVYNSLKYDFPGWNLTLATTKNAVVTLDYGLLSRTGKSQSYVVACFDEAQNGPAMKAMTVTVDLERPLTAISRTPQGFNTTTAIISVDTNKRAQCFLGDNLELFGSDSTGARTDHMTAVQGLPAGQNAVNVICRVAINTTKGPQVQEANIAISFIIDTTPPYLVLLSDASSLVNDTEISYFTDRLQADWDGRDEESQVTAYFYKLQEKRLGGKVIVDCMNASAVSRNGSCCSILPPATRPFYIDRDQNCALINLTDGFTYVLMVKPRNIVGLFGALNTSDGVVVDSTRKPAHCADGVKNDGESDIDCGGTCAPCVTGRACIIDTDCASLVCKASNVTVARAVPAAPAGSNVTAPVVVVPAATCAAPSCSDGKRNGQEGDVDCGGACAVKCVDGKSCMVGTDCASGACNNNICGSPSLCENGLRDGSESGVDCGGSCIARCAEGGACNSGVDCVAGLTCAQGVCTDCQPGDATCLSGDDADMDGIPDDQDKCSKTPRGAVVDDTGCSKAEKRSCGDEITDDWRIQYGFVSEEDVNDVSCIGDAAADADPDSDGLTNIEEFQAGSDPTNPDSDGDGWDDSVEVNAGNDPLNPLDHPSSNIWLWVVLLFILALIGGGIYGYMAYDKKHPGFLMQYVGPLMSGGKKNERPGSMTDDMQRRLEEARQRVAAKAAQAKGEAAAKRSDEDYIEIGAKEKKPSAIFQKLRAVTEKNQGTSAVDKEAERQEREARQKEGEDAIKALVGKRPGAMRPESGEETLRKLTGSKTEAEQKRERALSSLTVLALEGLTPKQRKDLISRLRLLQLGKLSSKEVEELLAKLRIEANYYKNNKERLQKELERYIKGD